MQEKHEEDPDGIRRNAEVIFAAGVSRDGAPQICGRFERVTRLKFYPVTLLQTKI